MDVCVITKGAVEYIRPLEVPNVRAPRQLYKFAPGTTGELPSSQHTPGALSFTHTIVASERAPCLMAAFLLLTFLSIPFSSHSSPFMPTAAVLTTSVVHLVEEEDGPAAGKAAETAGAAKRMDVDG